MTIFHVYIAQALYIYSRYVSMSFLTMIPITQMRVLNSLGITVFNHVILVWN